MIGSHFLLAEKKRKNLWYLLKVLDWPKLYFQKIYLDSFHKCPIFFKQKVRLLDKNNGLEDVFRKFFTNVLNFSPNTVRLCKITNV